MALMQINEAPPDAVRITEEEALKHQWDIVREWNPKSDV